MLMVDVVLLFQRVFPSEVRLMPLKITGLSPLLSVFDMVKSIHSYRDQLSLAAEQTSSEDPDRVNWATIELSSATVTLNTAYDPKDQPDTPDDARWSGRSDTCIYFRCPDVDAAYDLLRATGVASSATKVALYGMKQLCSADPDGYRLCFQWQA